MSEQSQKSRFSIARIYDAATRLYSAVPYTFFTNGYAFPAWHYYLEVTRRCNLRCKMCQYIDWLESVPTEEQKAGELSTDEWLRVIDQLPRFSLVTFTGGEPFVRKDFMQLLAYASARTRTHVISNTTMLDDEKAAACVKLAPRKLGRKGLNVAGTSIEAPGELHDEIRRMEGAFERSMLGVRLLRDHRERAGKACPMIHATTVIQRDNVHVLEQLPRVLKDGGVDVMNLVTETRMHDLPGLGEADPAGFKHNDLHWPRIDRKALSEALDNTIAAAKDAGIELRLPRMPKVGLLDYYEKGIRLKDYECRNAWNTLIIGRRGDAYPCWIVKVGNVRENSIKELWNNAAMRAFRQTCRRRLFAMCPGCCFLDHKSRRQFTDGA